MLVSVLRGHVTGVGEKKWLDVILYLTFRFLLVDFLYFLIKEKTVHYLQVVVSDR